MLVLGNVEVSGILFHRWIAELGFRHPQVIFLEVRMGDEFI